MKTIITAALLSSFLLFSCVCEDEDRDASDKQKVATDQGGNSKLEAGKVKL